MKKKKEGIKPSSLYLFLFREALDFLFNLRDLTFSFLLFSFSS
jgi:hypothetical protein